ncbi:hypothetical protein [Streptomyces sp. NPDC052042]|uniref:hypothetical protein n=1 Tax=Streptomyces sp. NPDC052042 TaxID=3365683 RepID=UPI0037D16346
MAADVYAGREVCPACPRFAVVGDTAADVEQREAERVGAIALLDDELDKLDPRRINDRAAIAEMEARMGQGIETQGCPQCGGTMYRTVETDDNGNPTSMSQFVCQSCGHVT